MLKEVLNGMVRAWMSSRESEWWEYFSKSFDRMKSAVGSQSPSSSGGQFINQLRSASAKPTTLKLLLSMAEAPKPLYLLLLHPYLDLYEHFANPATELID